MQGSLLNLTCPLPSMSTELEKRADMSITQIFPFNFEIMKWCPRILIECVNMSTMLSQKSNRGPMPLSRRKMEGS